MRDWIVVRWLYLLGCFVFYKLRLLGKVKFKGLTYIYVEKGASLIFKGGKTIINNSSVSNLFGLYQRTIFYVKQNARVIIGESCGISGTSFCARESIVVGDRVQIGANCKIMDNDMHSLDPQDRAYDNRNTIKTSPVVIGDDCFIGANSILLKGTTLGKNVIVGAGSVVHGKFPDNVIIAGNPAKIIR